MKNGRSRNFPLIEIIVRLYANSVKKETLKMYEGERMNSVRSKVLLEPTEDNLGCFQLEYFSDETFI